MINQLHQAVSHLLGAGQDHLPGSPRRAAVIERLLGRRELPDQTEAHRVDRFYRADDGE